MTLRALAVISVLAATLPARAGTIELVPTCVATDASQDSLDSLERTQALTMLRHVLEEQDLLVVDTGCVDTYTVFHVRDGAQWIVHVRGPHGGRKLHVDGMAELPDAYEKMVRALIEPAISPAPPSSPAAAPAEVVTPPASVEALPEPPLASASTTKRFLYAQLGAGGMGGAGSATSIAAGYRYERSGTAFDATLTSFSASGNAGGGGTRFTARLLHVNTPDSSMSPYFGGGLGYSGATINQMAGVYMGSGFEAAATAGIDFRRDAGLRMFVQVEAILPFYVLSSTTIDDSEYTGTLMISFGIGPAGR